MPALACLLCVLALAAPRVGATASNTNRNELHRIGRFDFDLLTVNQNNDDEDKNDSSTTKDEAALAAAGPQDTEPHDDAEGDMGRDKKEEVAAARCFSSPSRASRAPRSCSSWSQRGGTGREKTPDPQDTTRGPARNATVSPMAGTGPSPAAAREELLERQRHDLLSCTIS